MLDSLEQGGEQADVADLVGLLGYQLLACMRLVERDPGFEMAAADLFAAASALVKHRQDDARPSARLQRLLRDARTRFKGRLGACRPSQHGATLVWRSHDVVNAA